MRVACSTEATPLEACSKLALILDVCSTSKLIRLIELLITASSLSAQATIVEFPIPTADSKPACITLGPDGNLWFTESGANKIGTVTANGAFKEFVLPTPNSQPWSIAAGSDGNLWFTEISANKVGKITTTGSVTEYPIPTAVAPGFRRFPISISAGADGNLWYADPNSYKIGRVTTAGAITEYRIALNGFGSLRSIAADPDGNLWFSGKGSLGRISPQGAVALYTLDYTTADLDLHEVAMGSDGVPWVIGFGIFRLGMNAAVTNYSARGDGGIALGADGNLWLTSNGTNQIGRITPGGTATAYSISTTGALANPILEGSIIGGITPGSVATSGSPSRG